MNIKEIFFFQQVCECRSIRKAAEKLFISPQGLSKSIKNLEDELGQELLERAPQGVKATSAGEIVLKHADPILNRVERMKNELENYRENLAGSINIACAYGIISALELDCLMQFKQTYMNIDTYINEEPDLTVEEMVLKEAADIGVTIGPVDEQLFDAHLIRRYRLKLLVNKKNKLSEQQSVSFSELKDEPFILVNDKFKTHKTIVQCCHEAGFEPNIITSISEISMAHKYCHQNIGVGVTVDYVVNDIVFDDVEALDFNHEDCGWDVYLITRKGENQEECVRYFTDFMKNWFVPSNSCMV